MKYKSMNERMSHDFASSNKFVSNLFSMHNINVWNVQTMNEIVLHNLHYQIMRCWVCDACTWC
jgi:hypothetical protein